MHDTQRAAIKRAAVAFTTRFGGPPTWVAHAPGRINLIGEHTDYTGGFAMPAAINRWVCLALRTRGDTKIVVRSEDLNDEHMLASGQAWGLSQDAPTWWRLVAGAVATIEEIQPWSSGFDGLLAGNVPQGAGLSSSAAVQMALLGGLTTLRGLRPDNLTLARWGQQIEQRFLGVPCGLLDQLASQCSTPGHVMVIDFQTLTIRQILAPTWPWRWLVADTHVRRELAGSAYATRVQQCHDGLQRLIATGLPVTHHRDLTVESIERCDDPVLRRRLRHIVTENVRVQSACQAIAENNAITMGALLHASHTSLRDDFEVSCPQLDTLVDLAEAHPGCAGARMMGGGFGGCTISLIQDAALDDVTRVLTQGYQQRFGHSPTLHKLDLVGGTGVSTPDVWMT